MSGSVRVWESGVVGFDERSCVGGRREGVWGFRLHNVKINGLKFTTDLVLSPASTFIVGSQFKGEQHLRTNELLGEVPIPALYTCVLYQTQEFQTRLQAVNDVVITRKLSF
jgi:hypothetical protein